VRLPGELANGGDCSVSITGGSLGLGGFIFAVDGQQYGDGVLVVDEAVSFTCTRAGCMDNRADNYDAIAVVDNGICSFGGNCASAIAQCVDCGSQGGPCEYECPSVPAPG
jgi:hypothetical protein